MDEFLLVLCRKKKLTAMFEPTSYSENRYAASVEALVGNSLPPTSTVSTVTNITAVSGRFIQLFSRVSPDHPVDHTSVF